LGADGVEIDARHELPAGELSQTGLRQLRKMLGDLDLRVAALAFPTRRGYDDPNDLERRVLATCEALKLAYQLGSAVVTNRVGRIANSEVGMRNAESDQGDPLPDLLVQSLTALGACGEKHGARLAARTGSEGGPQLANLLAALPAESIGVDFDPAGLLAGSHLVDESLDALGRHVIYVHATDAVRDLALRRAVEVELGRGSVDLPGLFGRLEEFNYHGWVTIERNDSPDPATDIGNAVAYLRAL
jgi:sugar phosphate isomerase/epimerase